MPKKVKIRLKRQAKEKGMKPGSKSYRRYVYGTLNKIEDK